MITDSLVRTDRASSTTLSFLRRLLNGHAPRDFAIRLWDGTIWPDAFDSEPRVTIVLNHPGALRRMFFPPNEVTLAEAYLYGDFDIEGEIEAIFPIGEHLLKASGGNVVQRFDRLRQLWSLPTGNERTSGRRAARLHGAPHSEERDRAAVSYHYDVSNSFYALWLDRRMVYSCGYFSRQDESLDAAQKRKLDYICRKLRLRPGERLLDIGCGWGGLIIHAALNYGVSATGVTLSQPQADLANERIREAGLTDRCRVEVRDYRELNESGAYDKLASIGMFEHVGQARLPEYFGRAWRLLRPGGVFLNHGIAVSATDPGTVGGSFSAKYVFPDGELVPISIALTAAENARFEVRDVESLREHYVFTLRNWVSRLEAEHAAAVEATDEATYRIWRLYMSGSAYGFKTGQLNVYQALLVKSTDGISGLPLARSDWYTQ